MSKSIDEMAEDKISEAKAEVIAAISETMDLYGVTPSVGRLYATLYLNDQMTLNEMRDELNMSKPSMSTGIRKLQKYGMVKRKYEKGSREHTYKAEKNFFRSFMSFYWQMWEREATMNLDSIEDEHTSELQSRGYLVCRLLLENKNEGTEYIIQIVKYWRFISLQR